MTPETAAAPLDRPLIGQCIDERYLLEAVIGVGGLGSVYRATHTKLQRAVAVKLLHENLGASEVQRGRFAREAKALAALEHPNIVAVLDFGVSADKPYLVMELLEGETLSRRLKRGMLSIQAALWIAQQLLAALSFMHRAKLVHRDVKPSNVFLQRLPAGHERVKVLDFGLAKFTAPALAGGDPTLTHDGAVVGTPAYMSPEQATGDVVDERSDVYAVGVILFRMLAGHLPFEGDAFEQVRSHLVEPVPALKRKPPDSEVDPALEALIRRAMAKNRGERFVDAGQMLQALLAAVPQYGSVSWTEPVQRGSESVAVQEPVPGERPSKSDASNEFPTTPRPIKPRSSPRPGGLLVRGMRWVRSTSRALVVTSMRLFAGLSAVLVLAALAIFVLLLRSEADRAELSALQRRVSERFIERSMRRSPAPANPPAAPARAGADSASSAAAGASVVGSEQAAGAAAPGPGATAQTGSAPGETSISAATTAVDVAAEATALAGAKALAPETPAAAPGLPAAVVPSATARETPTPPPSAAGAPTAPASTSPEGVQPAAAEAPTPRATLEAMQPAASRPAARDPWSDPIPKELRLARKLTASGSRGNEALVLALRAYNRDHLDDPRGHLLLAQLYLNRYWRADGLAQFSTALQLDPSVRGAPEVLPRLLQLFVHGELARPAEKLIAKHFGVEAVPAIAQALSAATDPKLSARLRGLRVRMAQTVP